MNKCITLNIAQTGTQSYTKTKVAIATFSTSKKKFVYLISTSNIRCLINNRKHLFRLYFPFKKKYVLIIFISGYSPFYSFILMYFSIHHFTRIQLNIFCLGITFLHTKSLVGEHGIFFKQAVAVGIFFPDIYL